MAASSTAMPAIPAPRTPVAAGRRSTDAAEASVRAARVACTVSVAAATTPASTASMPRRENIRSALHVGAGLRSLVLGFVADDGVVGDEDRTLEGTFEQHLDVLLEERRRRAG